jgi:hypothetical protein
MSTPAIEAARPLIHWRVAPDDQIDAMTAWACWSVPLLLVEPLLQLRKSRRGAWH